MHFVLEPPPKRLELPRAIIFDWDNTLIDSWGVIHQSLVATFKEMGHPPWDMAETKARVRHSLRDSFPVLFGDRWQEARDAYYRHFEARHIVELRALEGAELLLHACLEHNIPALIISNKTGYNLRKEIDALGWGRYFRVILGAGDAPKDKPDPLIVDLALSAISQAPGHDVWFVGDTDVDLICANRGGCWPILVGDGDLPAAEQGNPPVPGWIFSSVHAIYAQMFENKQFC